VKKEGFFYPNPNPNPDVKTGALRLELGKILMQRRKNGGNMRDRNSTVHEGS